MKKTINDYVKNPRARFLIRIVAAAGYVILGSLWWITYGVVTLLYHFVCEILETLFIIMESLAAVRYKLKKLHKHFSYFEMLILFLGSVAIMSMMISLLWILAVIVPAGY